jgi:hypothetical protein
MRRPEPTRSAGPDRRHGSTGDSAGDTRRRDRAQAQIVGVSILLLVTVLSLGALTAGVGTVIEGNAASADAARVADSLASGLDPVETTGRSREELAFTQGQVETADRQLRLLKDGSTVETVEVGAVVYRASGTRVAYVAGAVVRGTAGSADLHTPPPVTASRGEGGVLVVGAPQLGSEEATIGGSGGASVPLRTNVRHERSDRGEGRFRVAIETTTPAALAPYFREQGATTDRRDIDGDGVPSLVATYPGERRAYLVVHEMDLHLGGPTDDGTPTAADDGSDEDETADDGDEGPPDGESGEDDDDGTLPVPPVDPPVGPVGPPDDGPDTGSERQADAPPGESGGGQA